MGGLPRSGSTLLRIILDNHPNIIAPPETSLYAPPYNSRIFEFYRRKYPLYIKTFADRIGISTDKVSKCLNNYENRIDLYDKLMMEYLKDYNVSNVYNLSNVNTWIQKTPSNCHYYRYIHDNHENVLFISNIRDGRDVVTSFYPGRKDGYYCSINRYIKVMRDVYSFKSSRHIIVRYEDFVFDELNTLKKILSFIGLEWSDLMLEKYLKSRNKKPNEKVWMGISNKWIGRWKDKYHEERIKKFYDDDEAVMWLEKSGYDVQEDS